MLLYLHKYSKLYAKTYVLFLVEAWGIHAEIFPQNDAMSAWIIIHKAYKCCETEVHSDTI